MRGIPISQLPPEMRAQVFAQNRAARSTPAPKATPAKRTPAARDPYDGGPMMTALERSLYDKMTEAGIKGWVRQLLLTKGKRRRRAWDFAFEDAKVLIEVQGGTWSKERSGHSTGTGIRDGCLKSNAAVLIGWRPLAFTPDLIRDGTAVATIRKALEGTQYVN